MSIKKTIIITGGAVGLGLELTRIYAGRGHNVIVCGRTESALTAVSEEYPNTTVFCLDLSTPSGRRQFVDGIHDLDVDVDLLIHNAAVQVSADFSKGAAVPERIAAELSINLHAPIELTTDLMPLLRKAVRPQIVFISSALGRVPKQSAPVYCATKAGLSTFARCLRYQLEGTPVLVTDVVPDLIRTRMAAGREENALHPADAANVIVRGLEQGKTEIRLGRVPVLYTLHRFLPSLAYRMLKAA
ncbi:SDR family NAD(P)-dependent oxidoreductase [Labrenzia sp. PHM005]|uniref:SDR family NAD(P)-dependent oxidoreductase n=1 Tax=Labrenzia sp. PHM005 TaxID=2590016 RepID=UPI00143E0202|nr:SDR family NAD(P)-dependent oxidoreductase [Labrenzia sp. PHM005]